MVLLDYGAGDRGIYGGPLPEFVGCVVHGNLQQIQYEFVPRGMLHFQPEKESGSVQSLAVAG